MVALNTSPAEYEGGYSGITSCPTEKGSLVSVFFGYSSFTVSKGLLIMGWGGQIPQHLALLLHLPIA